MLRIVNDAAHGTENAGERGRRRYEHCGADCGANGAHWIPDPVQKDSRWIKALKSGPRRTRKNAPVHPEQFLGYAREGRVTGLRTAVGHVWKKMPERRYSKIRNAMGKQNLVRYAQLWPCFLFPAEPNARQSPRGSNRANNKKRSESKVHRRAQLKRNDNDGPLCADNTSQLAEECWPAPREQDSPRARTTTAVWRSVGAWRR